VCTVYKCVEVYTGGGGGAGVQVGKTTETALKLFEDQGGVVNCG